MMDMPAPAAPRFEAIFSHAPAPTVDLDFGTIGTIGTLIFCSAIGAEPEVTRFTCHLRP